MYQQIRPTWAEISLDNLMHNIQDVRRCLPPSCQVFAVVKADAYGHGAIQVARAALEAGVERLAVSMVDEACELRQAGITAPILVLGYTPPERGQLAAALDLSLTVYEQENVQGLVQAAQMSCGKPLKVHLKVDTGMGRLGVMPDEAVAMAEFLQALPGCELEGIYTHLARADELDPAPTRRQLQWFEQVLVALREKDIAIPLVHAANSAASMRFEASWFNAVRVGLAMYGLYPHPLLRHQGYDLRPVMQLKTTVTHVKWLPAGCPISYGGHYTTSKPTHIVTLPIGYGDGYTRLMSNRGAVLLHGCKIPLVGAICMDQCMADATAVEGVQVGDEVTIWGEEQGEQILVDDIAEMIGTINYEVTCMISKRVPRLYWRQGEIVEIRTLLG